MSSTITHSYNRSNDSLKPSQLKTVELENVTEPTHGTIAARAYELWIQHGCPPDSADQDWVEAEAQVRTLHTALA